MLDNYEPVAVRLARLLSNLRAEGHAPRVVTVMLSQPGADICVFRAELWLEDQLMATGHAEEVRGQGNVNRTSHLENAETSALGRMCESYSPNPDWTQRPSREEMAKVERSSAGSSGGVVRVLTGQASEKQVAYIKGACKRAGVIAPGWLETLSKQDASAFIDAEKNGEPIQQIIDRMRGEEAF